MARSLTEFIGDALVAMFEGTWPKLRPRAHHVFEHIVDAVRPDPPMSLRTLDGATFTGIAIADRGQVLIFVGTRLPLPATQPRFDDEMLWRERQQHPFGR